jgi:hypothetical protein
MKQKRRSRALALLLAAALVLPLCLSLTGCSVMLDNMLGDGSGVKEVGDGKAGFVLTVPATWITAETVVYQKGGFTRMVQATVSNSSEDTSNMTAVTFETELSPQAFFEEMMQSVRATYATVSEVKVFADPYTLCEKKGVQYEYTVTDTDKAGTAYRVMQLLVPYQGRMTVLTYTAKEAHFDKNWSAVNGVLGTFAFADFVAPTPVGGEGMVKVSQEGIMPFSLSVPATWYNAVLTPSDYCKAISPDGKTTVNMVAFTPRLEGATTILNYWESYLEPQLTAQFGASLVFDAKGETVDFAGQKAGHYAYHGELDGEEYYFAQFYLQTSVKIFCFTVASTDPINVKEGDVADIIGSIGF